MLDAIEALALAASADGCRGVLFVNLCRGLAMDVVLEGWDRDAFLQVLRSSANARC
jgi:hypothetical protein